MIITWETETATFRTKQVPEYFSVGNLFDNNGTIRLRRGGEQTTPEEFAFDTMGNFMAVSGGSTPRIWGNLPNSTLRTDDASRASNGLIITENCQMITRQLKDLAGGARTAARSAWTPSLGWMVSAWQILKRHRHLPKGQLWSASLEPPP